MQMLRRLAIAPRGRMRMAMERPYRRALSTVVEGEVEKFTRASTDWWAPQSRSGMGPLHDINPVRVKYIRSQVLAHFGGRDDDPMPFQQLRMADIGCGGGILSESLCRLGAAMVSVDPGQENINAAKQHADQHDATRRIDYRCCTSDDLVAAQEQFDVVCSLEVIEHAADPKVFIESVTPLVKPGGLLFLSTMNRTFLSAALAIGMAEYVLRLMPPGTHEWSKFLQPEELKRMLHKQGLSVVNVSGIVGNPFTRNWRIDPYRTAINYILCASKPAKQAA